MSTTLTERHPRSDAALIARIAAGDDGALAALYDRHGALAFGLAHAIVGDTTLAADVVADAFARGWTEAASIDASRISVVGWLMGLVRQCALATSRRRRADPGPRDARRARHARDLRADAPRALPALARLLDDQRQVLTLAYFGGLTLGEIADVLHEPETRVRRLLRSAVDVLRADGAVPSSEPHLLTGV
jgi:RNA polymerase sigma-70 factor (ECF subfamily)